MRKLWSLAALTALIALSAAPAVFAQQDGSTFLDSGNGADGLIGYHVYVGNSANTSHNRGFSLDYTTTSTPGWSLGLEQAFGDLYLFSYNYITNTNPFTTAASNKTWFQMRGDTGQLTLGSGVGHAANGWQQVAIGAGTSTAQLDGLGITAYGTHNQLNLAQGTPGSNHTQINFASKFQIATDANNNGGLDMYVYDNTLSHQVLTINNADLVGLNYGLTVSGPTTFNTNASLAGGATIAGILQHSGNQLGFYGATPITKPVIQGCRSDGTALKNLLTALQNMGLITDQTTP